MPEGRRILNPPSRQGGTPPFPKGDSNKLDTIIGLCYPVTSSSNKTKQVGSRKEAAHSMKECYLAIIHEFNPKFSPPQGFVVEVAFIKRPTTYASLMRRLPNEARKLLARDKSAIKFEMELSCVEFSLPLFKDDPTGKGRFQNDFPHRQNMIGRLTLKPIRLL